MTRKNYVGFAIGASLLASSLSLGACATANGTLANAPSVARDVALTPAAAKDCLIASSPTGYRVAEYQGGYRVWQDGGTGTSINTLAVVTPTPQGSHVAIWHNWGANPFPSALEGCAGV